MKDALESAIVAMAKSAEGCTNALEAQQWSQAAVNLMNARRCLDDVKPSSN